LLMSELNISNPPAVAFILSCFRDYINFLAHQPANILDPHFPDVRSRVNLTLENQRVSFLWTNLQQLSQNPNAGQADHGAAFVIRVVQYAAGAYTFQSTSELLANESTLREVHVILCKLQSIWIGTSDVWIENGRLRGALHGALRRA
ncbi:hypothetical protein QBC40DRAFT_136745, partial [Triangularia verruculosa]